MNTKQYIHSLQNLLFCSLLLCIGILPNYAQPPHAGGQWQGRGSSGDRAMMMNKPGLMGKVTDGEQGIPFANIVAYNSADSTKVKGMATDSTGRFFLPLPAGDYYAKISFLSMRPKQIDSLTVTDKAVKLGRIALSLGNNQLDAVEVRGEKSVMELKLDKRVFNVGKDLVNAGNNAAEILDNVPSVTVDIDGNVSLRGSENVRILVDGKESGLVGTSSTDALRQLSGALLDKIEVITNPSARYDAEGEVGIINLVLKKKKDKGVNGSFELKAGYPENFGAAYNLNFRRKKMNFFSNFGINYMKRPGSGSFFQRINNNDGTISIYETDREHKRGGLSTSIQLGTDLFINKTNTLTMSGLYKYSNNKNNASLEYRDFDLNNQLINTTTRTDEEDEPSHDAEAALSYKKTFSRKGHAWTIDAKYMLGDDTEYVDYTENSTAPSIADIIQRSSNREYQQTILVQTDYVLPFAKDGKFETGLKTTLRNINNDYTVEQFGDNIWEVLPNLDNELAYKENIHAAYVMLGNKTGRFSYQAGLRTEYSDIKTELLETNESNPRDYLNFFPSFHLGYEFGNNNTFQLSYSRRITRPRFWFLLPFFTFSDSRNRFTGNPDLDPEYTDAYEMGYLKNFEKGTFLSSLYYRYKTDVITRIILTDLESGTGNTNIFPVNLATEDAYGMEFNLSYSFTQKWRVNANLNAFRAVTDGTYTYLADTGEEVTVDLESNGWTWRSRISTKIKLPQGLDFQTSLNYRAPLQRPQGKSLSVYAWDMAFAKDILKGNGTLTLSGKDLMNSRKRRIIIDTDDLYSETEFQWRARQILLTFNYRLNQKKRRYGGGRGGYSGGGDY